jgi:ubiquinone/menaquinone biosynthesis C-methylase UbiE
MFISPHDPLVIREKLLHAGVLSRINPFAFSATARVKARWSQTEERLRHWYQVPTVIDRLNKRISGDPSLTLHDMVCQRYLNDGRKRRALALGCGIGGRELDWARRGVFTEILGLDIAPERIARANEEAARQNIAHIARFEVNDVKHLIVQRQKYDVVLFEQSLHHFTDVKATLSKIKRILAPDGFLIVDEFVGPRRFQWTAAQLTMADGLLRSIPARYRRFANSNRTKNRNLRAGTFLMWLNDPSEAIESDAISGEIERQFEVLARHDYGGTLTQLLFQDIAHHFIVDDGENIVWANRILDAEECLIGAGVLASDYSAFICRQPAGSAC